MSHRDQIFCFRSASLFKLRGKSARLIVGFLFSLVAALPVRAAEDLSLNQAFVLAYQNDPGLQAERARVRATDNGVSEALSGYRPRVNLLSHAGKLHERITGGGIGEMGTAMGVESDNDLSPRGAGVEVVQPVFRGFRTQAAVEAADKQVLAARALLTDREQTLLFDTGAAFLDIVRETAMLDLLDNHEKLLQEQLAEAEDRLKAGLSTQTDVLQAQSRLDRVHADHIEVQGRLTSDRTRFERLTGHAAGHLNRPSIALDDPASLQEAVAQAETKNPKVVAASYLKDGAEQNIRREQGGLLPEVNLVGNVSRDWEQSTYLPGREDSARIMVQLKIPLYNGGEDYARTREARETMVGRGLDLQNLRLQAHEETVQSWSALTTARTAVNARQTAIKAAESALNGVQEEQKAGTRTTLDVLNAQQEVLDARVGLVSAQHDEDLAILRIKSAVGKLTADSLGLATPKYDPDEHYQDVRDQWFGLGG